MDRTTRGTAALALALLLAAEPAQATDDDNCVIPVPPRMPDAEVVTASAMGYTRERVEAYLTASRVYLACFRRQERKWAPAMTPARRQFLDQVWNAQVDRMHRTANHFNVVLAEFRLLRGDLVASVDEPVRRRRGDADHN